MRRRCASAITSRDASETWSSDNTKNAYDQAQVGLNEATIDSAVSPLGHADRANGVRDSSL